ncbi:MAG: glycerophosphodiester phosphodiesterase [Eubacteriales bacterium]|nr:glycerophosphodiester phosphodiesterase [Eubacteriales bacterium]
MTLIFAHRGYSDKYPENTMLAYEKAVEAGADGIEMDVQMSKDGELVIMHDEAVDRTTNGHGLVKDLTLAELKQLDASYKFGDKYGVNRVPTLREFFRFVKMTGIMVNVELKTGVYTYDGIEEKTLAMIDEFGLRDKIIISSFNHYSVMKMKKMAPDMKYGLLEESWIIGMPAYAEDLKVNYLHPVFNSVSEEMFRESSGYGIGINTWTVNDPAEMERLLKLGVNGIITNDPALVRQVALQCGVEVSNFVPAEAEA